MEEKKIIALIVSTGTNDYIDFDEKIPFLKDGDKLVYHTARDGSVIVRFYD